MMSNRKGLSTRSYVALGLAAIVILGLVGFILLVVMRGVSTKTFFLKFSGTNRSYDLHVPGSYDGKTPVALVIMLHGGAHASGSMMEGSTRWSEKSDAEGFIVAYPNGVGASWNARFGFPPASATNIDDVGFIRALIDRLEQEYRIDQNRVYVAGFSNGACMAYRLAAEIPDRIAAIAACAGTIGARIGPDLSPVTVGQPTGPVSVVVFHELGDPLVPYNGGVGVLGMDYLSVNESVSFWVRCDGCNEKPLKEEKAGGVVKYTYSGGRDSTEVVLFALAGSNNEWPVPLATDEVWTFFKSHPKQ